jgi:murein DD-endopeptidase MepM/ murein hydrolase activator NlpD
MPSGESWGESSRSKAQARYAESVEAELAAVSKTQGLLADKLTVRQAEMKKRVRSLYKLSRGSFPRLWIEPKERRKVSQWLGAARRITNRDLDELQLLREEIEVASAAETRLKAVAGDKVQMPARRSLQAPLARTRIVARYGQFRGQSRRVRLRRRGLELAAVVGEEVHAPAAGRVRYAGPISGLGQGIILDHDGYLSVLGHLEGASPELGQEVEAGAVIARAAQERLYLEVRVVAGSVGRAVDPAPLLAR